MIKLKLRQTLRLLVLVAVMPLAACTILPESPIQQVYLLPAQPVAVAGGQMVWHYRLIRSRSREGCFTAFSKSHWIGVALFAGVVLAYAIR